MDAKHTPPPTARQGAHLAEQHLLQVPAVLLQHLPVVRRGGLHLHHLRCRHALHDRQLAQAAVPQAQAGCVRAFVQSFCCRRAVVWRQLAHK